MLASHADWSGFYDAQTLRKKERLRVTLTKRPQRVQPLMQRPRQFFLGQKIVRDNRFLREIWLTSTAGYKALGQRVQIVRSH